MRAQTCSTGASMTLEMVTFAIGWFPCKDREKARAADEPTLINAS
jgi:hypothetical protein